MVSLSHNSHAGVELGHGRKPTIKVANRWYEALRRHRSWPYGRMPNGLSTNYFRRNSSSRPLARPSCLRNHRSGFRNDRRRGLGNRGDCLMTSLVDFYRGEAADTEGRILSDMWNWSDEELEINHDFIQWMFPTSDPSRYNPDAPLLTNASIAEFKNDARIQINLGKSFERILAFFGFARSGADGVVESLHFFSRVPDVWAAPNHNWLRITRVLLSLRALGMEIEARQLYERLDRLYSSRRFPITADTFSFWTRAARSHGG